MPIIFDPQTKKWELKDADKAEVEALLHIGKQVIVNTTAAGFSKETFIAFLEQIPKDHMYEA